MAAMPTSMSTAVSSAASATPSSSSCSTADFTQFPTKDVACAVGSTSGIPSNTSSILKTCCKTAPVNQFNGACGYYCLSEGQSVGDLQKCFMDNGVKPNTIFCSGNNTATATAQPSSSAQATGSQTSGAPGSSGSSSSPKKSNAAMPGVVAPIHVSKAGLGMMGMVVVSLLAGAFL